MTWTKSGSVNLTNGNAVVYGTGTAWVSGGMARPGDVFIAPGGDLYEVASIQSNTQLTLSSLYLGSTASGQSYSLIHTGLLPAELAINLSSLQSKYLTTISQLWEWETSNAATVPLTNPATGVTTNVKPISGLVLDVGGKAPIASPSFTGTLTHSGDVVLSGSGKRITGDFTNATVANRVMFQTNVVNGDSGVVVAPNGIGTTAVYGVVNRSDPTNAAFGELLITPLEVRLASGVYGGGGYLPMTFHTGGAERMRIDTTGGVHVGVKGSYGQLFLNATDSTLEGGELVFRGAASYSDWVVDRYGDSLRVYTAGAGSFLVVSPNGLGYGPGAGGTVTQSTSKSTAVTLNKPCGLITMHNSTLAAGASVDFTLNSTFITQTDTVIVNMEWAVQPVYRVEVSAVGVHAARIRVTNISTNTLSESVPLIFAIIKGATL